MTANIIIQSSVGTPGTIANNTLSNLGTVSLNTDLLPSSAFGRSLGSVSLPFSVVNANYLVGYNASDTDKYIAAYYDNAANAGYLYAYKTSTSAFQNLVLYAPTVSTSADLVVTGELKGCRECITFGYASKAYTSGVIQFMNLGENVCTSTYGCVMPRAGSIVGISVMLTCSAFTSAGYCYANSFINNVGKGSIRTSITGTGDFSSRNTFARGTYSFSAGDLIQADVNSSGFVATLSKHNVLVEVVFDT